MRHLPDRANTVILFNVDEILASPLAVKEGWAAKEQQAFAANWIVVPPGTMRYAGAAQLELASMQPLWQAGVAELQFEPSMAKAAALHGGSVDEISGRSVAALPPDMYVVQFGKQLAGFLRPANRQDAGRWIDDVYSDSSRMPLSPYLVEGVGFADKLGTPIIVAVDLKHVFPVAFIRGRLGSLQTLQGQNLDLDQLSTALAGVKGMTLGITVTDRVYGKVKVDFEQAVPLTAELAKPLLLEALANHGAMIEEFKEWQAEVKGNEITLGGYLQQSGMQRIFSLLDAPPAMHVPPPSSPADVQQTDQKYLALASQQYFKSVTSLLDDLTGKRKSDEFVTWGEVGLWFEKYAARIDQLPILHVDPDLVDWGSNVSAQLRQAESSMKGIGVPDRLPAGNGAQRASLQYSDRGGVRCRRRPLRRLSCGRRIRLPVRLQPQVVAGVAGPAECPDPHRGADPRQHVRQSDHAGPASGNRGDSQTDDGEVPG